MMLNTMREKEQIVKGQFLSSTFVLHQALYFYFLFHHFVEFVSTSQVVSEAKIEMAIY